MVKAAIVGATGYTGLELVKILSNHPKVEIVSLTAKIKKVAKISEIFPELQKEVELFCYPFKKNQKELLNADVIFLAVPHGVSLDLVKFFLEQNKKVIDLSADYRLRDVESYKKWYKKEHPHSHILNKAVYGLTEINRKEIRESNLVANPGCYPTSVLLPLLPVLEGIEIDSERPIIVDSKTGTTGAGRKGSLWLSFSELTGNIKPYKVDRHQHSIEILQQIEKLKGECNNLIFTPHIVPIKRGILSLIYVPVTKENSVNLNSLINDCRETYKSSKFISVLDSIEKISILNVANSNKCHIGFTYDEESSTLIIGSTIDNLLKGAAGQAVQNMNVIYGFKEHLALI